MQRLIYPINGDSNSNAFQAFDPLEFAEFIARMAGPQKESSESMSSSSSSSSSQTKKLPSKINTTFLAQELSRAHVPPILAPSLVVDSATKSSTGSKQHMSSRALKEYEATACKTAPCSTTNTLGKKRCVSVSSDQDAAELNHSPSLMPWDLNFLLKHNPDDTMSILATKELRILAREFEAMRKYDDWGCNNSYNRMRVETFEASKSIAESTCAQEEKSTDYNQLYTETISHMRALIAMADHLEKGQKEKSVKTEKPSEKPTRQPYNKKEFTESMIVYLKENWTNPYPDRPAIREIAEKTGAKYSTVNNWLINARTRKWKPSIEQALEMKLPSATLEEDSKNIFDERFLKKASKKRTNKK